MTPGPVEIDDSEISEILSPYGCAPTPAQTAAIRAYLELLLRWNERISLTTVTDPVEILKFHIGESLEAIRAAQITKGRLADVGSGAGLPGVPLALFMQQLRVSLIEANAKKTAFLSEVQRSLNLNNTEVIRGRFEDLKISSPRFDFVTARALGSYDHLLAWARDALNPSGRVILWLGVNDASKISESKGWRWQTPQKIPRTKNRVLIFGQISR